MNIQSLFDKLLETDNYNEHTYEIGMCSLAARYLALPEYEYVKEQIYEYLDHLCDISKDQIQCAFLVSALEEAGMNNSFESCLAIYKDWANRPMIRNQRI